NRSTGQKGLIHAVDLDATEFTPTAVLPTGVYTAWSRGWDATGVAADWSPSISFTVVLPAPIPLSPHGSVSGRSVFFEWTSVNDTARYELRVRNNTTRQDNVISRSNLTTTRYVHPQRLPSGSYLMWIRAFDEHNLPGTWAGGAFQIAEFQDNRQSADTDAAWASKSPLDDGWLMDGLADLHTGRQEQLDPQLSEFTAFPSLSAGPANLQTVTQRVASVPATERPARTRREDRSVSSTDRSETALETVFVEGPTQVWTNHTEHLQRTRSVAVSSPHRNRDDD
ncbi:MAG: hypothetical protein ABGZ17_20905, partial [Planctomycetaceae bacterium]